MKSQLETISSDAPRMANYLCVNPYVDTDRLAAAMKLSNAETSTLRESIVMAGYRSDQWLTWQSGMTDAQVRAARRMEPDAGN